MSDFKNDVSPQSKISKATKKSSKNKLKASKESKTKLKLISLEKTTKDESSEILVADQ